jgi:hypothetical protein
MAEGDAEFGTAPYASGGGGTVLEHLYGAILLSSMLVGDPVTELGDDATLVSVRFQGRSLSPVDDLMVSGLARDGERRVSIGVRRAPDVTKSNDKTARLLASYVKMVAEHWEEITAGRWRLCLAVAVQSPAISQLRDLTVIAGATTDDGGFRAEVGRDGRVGQSVRTRLKHVDALIASAARQAGTAAHGTATAELTWRVLHSLQVRVLRLESGDAADRTHAVSRLRLLTAERTAAAGDDLFARIAELAGRYASTGAEVSADQLRTDLGIAHIQPQPRFRPRVSADAIAATRPFDPAAEPSTAAVPASTAAADAGGDRKYTINVFGASNVQIGDQNRQSNYHGPPSHSAPDEGYAPAARERPDAWAPETSAVDGQPATPRPGGRILAPVGEGGAAERERRTAPPVSLAVQARRARGLAPDLLKDREAELKALELQSTGDEAYFFWQGASAAGKTALLATFVANGQPESACVVSFFITGTDLGQADANAFTTSMCEQLCAILGEGLPAAAGRRRHLPWLYEQAASKVRSQGQRLVLVVDALDEDRWRPGAELPSIASLLPRYPAPSLTVIVSGRIGVDLPRDLPSGHPLKRCEPIPLKPSPYATDVMEKAQLDLSHLRAAGTRHWHAIGFLAASGGGLSRDDMEELLGAEHRDPRPLFGTDLERIIAERDEGLQFWHDTLREAAVKELGRDIETYRKKIHEWADGFRARQWPEDTPRYLIRSYPEILRGPDDIGVMVQLATSRPRQSLLLKRARGDAALAMAQVDAAAHAVLRLAEPDLTAMARLAISRDELEHPYLHIPLRLPVLWALLGEQRRAETLASLIAGPDRRAKAHQALAGVTEADPWPDLQQRLRSLSRKIARCQRRQDADEPIAQAELILGSITDPFRCADAVATLAGAVVASDPYHRAARLVAALADDDLRARAREELIGALVGAKRRDAALALIKEVDDAEQQARAQADYVGALARHRHLKEAGQVAHRITHQKWHVKALMKLAENGPPKKFGTVMSQAQEKALAVTDAEQQTDLLLDLCARLAGARCFPQAKALVRKIPDSGRDAARMRMAQALAESGDLRTATTAARSVSNRYKQQRAFLMLVPPLAERGDIELARQLAGSITFRDFRYKAVLALAKALLIKTRDVAHVADCSCELLAQPEARIQLLADCVPYVAGDSALAQELLSRTAALADDVVGQPARASALATLAEAYAAVGDHARARQAAEQSEEQARSVPREEQLARDLTAVTEAMSGWDPWRAEALAERALSLMHDVADSGERFTLQVRLVRALSASSSQAGLRDLARRITGPYRKPDHMVKLVDAACKAGLDEDAAEIARSILDPARRSSALAASAKACARAGNEDAAQLVREAENALASAGWAATPAKHTLAAALEAGCAAIAERVYRRACQEAGRSGDPGAESLIDLLQVCHKYWPGAARNRDLARRALEHANGINDAEPRIRAITRLIAEAGADYLDEVGTHLERTGAAAMELTNPARSRALAGLARAAASVRLHAQAQAFLEAAQVPAQDLPECDRTVSGDPKRIRDLVALVRRAPDGTPDVPMWLEEASRLAEDLKDAGQRARARADLAEAAARKGQRDVAEKLIKGARADSDLITVPDTSRAVLSALAVSASAVGDVPGARETLRHAAAFVPMTRHPDLDSRQAEVALLARTVADAGDHAHALVLARAVDDPGDSASVMLAIARSLVKQGNLARARALVDAARGGHRARGLASLALRAVQEGRHDPAAELLADAVEAARNLQEQPAREEAVAAVVKAAADAGDYGTATGALGMVADPKRRDEALLAIARSRVELGDYVGAQRDIEQIRNPVDKVHGLTLFIRAGWAGEDGNRRWAAEGAPYVADIPDAADRVRVCASFAQALAEHGWRDDALSLIREVEPTAASLTGSARNDALAALARAARSARNPVLATSLVAAISDPGRKARARREHLLTSAPADGMTLAGPESGPVADPVDRSRLLLACAAREKDFTLPERRRFVAEALTMARWTNALEPLGRVDADALLAVADDFLAPSLRENTCGVPILRHGG